MLLTIHAGLAIKTGWEELALDEEEANKLARSSVELAEHYGVEVNPKTQAWLRFIGAVGSVYGTRAIAIILKEKDKAKPEEKPTPGPRLAVMPNA